MNGKAFIRRATAWAKTRGVATRVDAARGKGGHQLFYVGAKRTTVQSGEIAMGTLHAMLKQLGIPKEEF